MLNLNLLLLMNILTQPLINTYEVERINYEASTKALSNNNYLLSVKFKDITFIFDKEVTKYVIEVPYSKSKLELSYLQEDSTSQVEVAGDEELLVGNNSLALLVTAEDGSLREYDFTIIRSEDNTIVQSDLDSIRKMLVGSDASKLTINMSTDLILDEAATKSLKDSGKTLVFKWADFKNNFISSLTVDGTKIKDTNQINPKVGDTITNSKLKNYLKDTDYTSLSTNGTNIPEGSIYKLAVSGTEDYYLYYYDGDELVKKPLRVIDNAVEFEMKSDVDYAITTKSNRPQGSTGIGGLYWLWISLFITVLFIIFFAITRYTALKVVQNSHKSSKNDKN